jgi:hypothetical protein
MLYREYHTSVEDSSYGEAGMARRHLTDWAMLLSLTVMWGSAFLFTKIA